MDTRALRYSIIALGLLGAPVLAALAIAVEEEQVALDQVPPAVRDTILREADGAEIREIERATKGDVTIYEAEFLRDGAEVELRIAADGTLLRQSVEGQNQGAVRAVTETNVTLEEVPPAARTALLNLAGPAPFTELEREMSRGTVVYEAEWMIDGVEHEAAVMEDGTLLETEQTIPAEQAPSGVRSVILKHFGAETPVSVEMKTIILYEIEGKPNGRGLELMVSPTGRLLGGDDDDDDDDEDDDDGDDGDKEGE